MNLDQLQAPNKLVQFATSRKVLIKSKYAAHKNMHKQTFISRDGFTRKAN